ncbi:hypothetical protein UCRNP2_7431 [Neofusicoccum parvum UCRNP2]|uniref:Uncharacterized protein n=1 Tax=Botryosphaeria parva (strain UCR-NP2) TaxID=1287680 RepID=R1GIN0_BOTPV|nr:hypothetical protein UCRNP2_7431 [Neofusicoccum parvum UCRNP2]
MLGKTILPVLAFLSALFATASAQAQPDYISRNLDTIRKIYDLTVYPRNAPIVSQGASAVPAGLFNENAVGRISPIGNFTGFDDSIEYFFGLAPTPDSNPAGAAIYKAEVVEFTSGCADVASSLVYLRTGTVDNTTGQVAFWKFDEQGAVLNYHAWIPNLQTWTEVGNNIDFDNVVIQKAVTAAICPQIQDRCKGKDQQYSNVVSCIAQLELKPFGSFDEAWGDNVVCRQIHLLLTKTYIALMLDQMVVVPLIVSLPVQQLPQELIPK